MAHSGQRFRLKTVLFVLVLVILGYHLQLLFSESLYLEKGSYAYYLLIPKTVRNLPVFEPLSEAIYFSEMGDVGPEVLGVRYQTSLNEQEIIKAYHDYFCSLDYHQQQAQFWGAKLAFQKWVDDRFYIFFVKIYSDSVKKNVYIERFYLTHGLS